MNTPELTETFPDVLSLEKDQVEIKLRNSVSQERAFANEILAMASLTDCFQISSLRQNTTLVQLRLVDSPVQSLRRRRICFRCGRRAGHSENVCRSTWEHITKLCLNCGINGSHDTASCTKGIVLPGSFRWRPSTGDGVMYVVFEREAREYHFPHS